ncbi:S8 family peptidase [Paracoccus fistulariae]|uniref:S8 family serine peptidase n=1 Tax=Paracoccus fistulariae TaxID=658446 RepID=A0ABY7SPA9_9RHOB|nr:S8 family serine peptidase [Paracoccus fistulariae]MDB6183026.1 S8 family serine peptidase [Paracoccus fistulariae]WCR08821.1 S8 family serine peptidase [Paracoccus fistulariae]
MQDYDDRDHSPRDTRDDWAELELVYAEPRSEDTVQALVTEVLGEGLPVAAVFDPQSDHHFFLTLVGLLRMSEEEAVFALAREYRPVLQADEINPALIGGLYFQRAGVAPGLLANLCSTPEVPLSPTGWPHQMVGTKGGWNTQKAPKGRGGIVAVIDTGHSSHDELTGSILTHGQLNLVEGGTDARDRFNAGIGKNAGHGTLVCSVLASRGDIDSGFNMTAPGKITGVAPAADVLPIRAFRSVMNLSQRTIPRAISHATRHDARVITMAMGAPYRISATEKAMRQAVDEGVLLVCAAGNCWPWTVFPAAYAPLNLCSAAGAVRQDKSAWPNSSRGPETTISAPGENVWGATKPAASSPDDAVKPAQGTTLATAMTSGAAILWSTAIGSRDDLKNLAKKNGMTGQQLFNRILQQTAERPANWPPNYGLGAGILRIDRMFQAVTSGGNVARTDAGDPGPDIDLALAPWGTVRTIDIVRMLFRARAPEIEAELGEEMADYAPEILWRAQIRGSGRSIDGVPPWLRDRPLLRSYLTQ